MANKTIGQISHEAFSDIRPGTVKPWHDLKTSTQSDYEFMASAVWNRAVEACANAIEEAESELAAAEGEVYILIKAAENMRSLKRTMESMK